MTQPKFITLEQARHLLEQGTPIGQVIELATGCKPVRPEPQEVTPETAKQELDALLGFCWPEEN